MLVHGAFHGGWCYARVAALLRAQGHHVFTPTLTGLGERSHLAHIGVNASMHVNDVTNVIIWEQLDDVVLCGHASSGIIVAAVADRMPDRIAALVYLDAAVPEGSGSNLDLVSVEEQVIVLQMAAANGGLMLPASGVTSFDVNPADREMVETLATPHPLAAMCERLPLTGAYNKVTKVYIHATRYKGSHPKQSYEQARSDPNWITYKIDCGHDIMLDAPERLAEILNEFACYPTA